MTARDASEGAQQTLEISLRVEMQIGNEQSRKMNKVTLADKMNNLTLTA